MNRLKKALETLSNARYGKTYPISIMKMKTIGYGEIDTVFEDTEEDGWIDFQNGSRWGGVDAHTCFKFSFQVIAELSGKELWLQAVTSATDIWNTDNPQFILFINDKLICGMDMNHREVCLTKDASINETFCIGIYAYVNGSDSSDFLKVSIREKIPIVEKLYYDFKVLYDVLMIQEGDGIGKVKLEDLLNKVVNILDFRVIGSALFIESVKVADKYLFDELNKDRLQSPVTVHGIGHTHIDIAWKWPLRQTREKVIRSFATVLQLMEEYPDYRFMSSQPQLYEFVKEDCPLLFNKIKEKIKEGRWEAEGSMWLEADCNLTSGESLIRQILYGKMFFKEEFNIENNEVLWLPDVFGYSTALPQIMKKSKIKYFMTTKINWNEYNKLPNDVTIWRGNDGSEVLSYFITTTAYIKGADYKSVENFSTTYNGLFNACQIMGTWQRFRNKNLSQDVLTCYGYGDGGGGPTAEMLEEYERFHQGIPGFPNIKQTSVRAFFHLLEKNLEGKKVPKWVGELYLEYHRGTYTSMARNKKYNRKCEFQNGDAEFLAVLAMLHCETYEYPKKALDQIWKITLLNQFHDILPGTSIEEVYTESKSQYVSILSESMKIIKDAMKATSNSFYSPGTENGLTVFNTLSFKRDVYLEMEKEAFAQIFTDKGAIISQETYLHNVLCFIPDVPARGYKILTDKDIVSETKEKVWYTYEEKNGGVIIETTFYLIHFDENREIKSLLVKENNREIVLSGKRCNQLIAFEDRPFEYDCWNIDAYYVEKSYNITEVLDWKVVESGPLRIVLYIKRKFFESTIEQYISLFRFNKRIDFKTLIDWKQEQILLKVAFPVDVLSDKVICETQFGNIERPTHRNTSWEQAKFEFCAHKWIDLAESNFGVSLLNDCKYGYDVYESTMRLTLLKSGIFPNKNADKERHAFTYSFYAHSGSFREGGVIKEAYDLNVPVYYETFFKKKIRGLNQHSVIEVDVDNVIVETIKLSEDRRSIIVRIYECFGQRKEVHLFFYGWKIEKIYLCNLLEEIDETVELEYENNRLSYLIHPYKIETFKLTLKGNEKTKNTQNS
ncbi:MAG: alpha-mannosidase [Lachnospiraceae bacterium]